MYWQEGRGQRFLISKQAIGPVEPVDLLVQFGIGSEFGFENPLPFFGLLERSHKPTPAWFGIRSVSVDAALPAQKTRYKSSPYCPGSVLSELLIIGRSKVQVLLGPPSY
jgi:hypothetical protein